MHLPFLPHHAPVSGASPRTLVRLSPPPPALVRGWLHARDGRGPFMIRRMAIAMGRLTWLSHTHESHDATGSRLPPQLVGLAGRWPSGGFVELTMELTPPLGERPWGDLTVYAASPERASALFADLSRHYMYRDSLARGDSRTALTAG